MIYAMNFDENGNGDSGFEYPDGTTLPTGQVACTFEQYQNPSQWTLVNGSLVQSLTYAKAAQSALIKQGFANAVAAIPFTINGVNYTLDTAQTKQAADMAIVVAANNAMNHPVLWAASTAVAQYAVQLVGSSYLFCTVAGTTGTAAPTPPTTFGTTIVAPAVASNEAVNLGQFPASLSRGGYQKLANGLIIQWGITGTLAATSSNIITLPIAFPNAGLAYIANSNDGGDTAIYRCNAAGGTTTSITIVNAYTSSIPGAAYLAIGY